MKKIEDSVWGQLTKDLIENQSIQGYSYWHMMKTV